MLDRLRAALSDRYTVERELGRGGMASVWLAHDRRLDRAVAIKVLHPELAGAIERGDFARARAAFEAAARLTTDVELVNITANQALAAARAGAPGEAQALLQRSESLAATYVPMPLHTAVYIAEARASLGDAAGAVEWLERYSPAADLHFQTHLRCDPPFEPIENDSRFRSLLLKPRPDGSRGC